MGADTMALPIAERFGDYSGIVPYSENYSN